MSVLARLLVVLLPSSAVWLLEVGAAMTLSYVFVCHDRRVQYCEGLHRR